MKDGTDEIAKQRVGSPLPDLDLRWDGSCVVDLVSGAPIYFSANHIVAIDPLPSPDERKPYAVHFNQDGSAADERTEYWMRRDAADYLTIWHGRLYREPPPLDGADIHFGTDLESAMEEFNRIYPIDAGSSLEVPRSPFEIDRLSTNRRAEDAFEHWLSSRTRHRSPRRRRHMLDLPPSDWRRFVRRRLALIFRRSERDRLLGDLTEYFCGDDDALWWVRDPRFALFLSRLEKEPRTRRLLNVLHVFAARRRLRNEPKRVFGERRRVVLASGRGRYTFDFPPSNRKGSKAGRATQLLLLVSYVGLHQRALKTRLPKLCAAAVYEAREYLVAPKSLRAGPLTQAGVAKYFCVTRRQLQAGLQAIREPNYAMCVFRLAWSRKALSR